MSRISNRQLIRKADRVLADFFKSGGRLDEHQAEVFRWRAWDREIALDRWESEGGRQDLDTHGSPFFILLFSDQPQPKIVKPRRYEFLYRA